MKKMALLPLVLLILTALGSCPASSETFAEEYLRDYIEMFGEERITLKEPVTTAAYTSGYIEMFGEDYYRLHNNQVPDKESWEERHRNATARMFSLPAWEEWHKDAVTRMPVLKDWEEWQESAVARMPTFPSWEERQQNLTLRTFR